MGYPDHQERKYIYISNLTSSILGIFGCLFIITVFFSFKELRRYANKLIVVLAFFDILNNVGFLIPTIYPDGVQCVAQSIIISIGSTSSILWTCIISYSLYKIIVKNDDSIKNYYEFQVVAVLLISVALAIVPFVTGTIGKTSGWCWIRKTDGTINLGFYERLFFLFFPLTSAIVFNITVYYSVRKYLILHSREDIMSENDKKILNKKLVLYPILMIICYFPYAINNL